MVNYKVIAQNFVIADEVSTGIVTCSHLYQVQASGCLLGHPDINDDQATLVRKIRAIISLMNEHPEALPFNVLMLGETLEEFNNNSLYDIAMMLKNHCTKLFADIPDSFIKQSLLVYEPKWAFKSHKNNSSLVPSPKLITQVTNKMRDFLVERLGPDGFKVSLMYGEVSSPERAVEILKNENLQGLMLGSACNSLNKLLDVIKAIQHAYDKRKLIIVCNFKSFDLTESFEDYIKALDIFPDNFTIYFAPPSTHLYKINQLLSK